MLNRRSFLVLTVMLAAWFCAPAFAQEKSIVVASTTSTQDSGLFGHLLPLFKAKTGIEVRVIAQGTGQALDTARRGDADVVFVHARPQEEKFVADGFGVRRFDVMYNDFVLIGPKSDPAGIAGTKDIVAALTAVRAKQVPFVSRGDRSGTHQAELALWQAARVDIAKDKAAWYREIGQGMGAALNTASAMNAYVLADRGTWISFKNRADLAIAVEGDRRLFNQYGIILVNPEKFPHVKKEDAQAFIDWIVSPEGQKAIAAYRIGGEQLFFPNAQACSAAGLADQSFPMVMTEERSAAVRCGHRGGRPYAALLFDWHLQGAQYSIFRGAGRRLASAAELEPHLRRADAACLHDQGQASGNAGGAPTSRCTAGQHVSLPETRLVRRNDTHRLIPSKY